jgi:hypothetical protein
VYQRTGTSANSQTHNHKAFSLSRQPALHTYADLLYIYAIELADHPGPPSFAWKRDLYFEQRQ